MVSIVPDATAPTRTGREFHGLLILASVAFLLCLPSLLWHVFPSKDTAFFYSPMIREIACGNFAAGYFPFIPPLFSSIGAVFAVIFRLEGFAAARLTSALFFAAGVFPLYYLAKHIVGRHAAWYAVILYIVCPRLIRYGGSGLLDPGKTFLLLATAWLTWALARRRNAGTALALGLSAGALALVKGEGIVVSAAFLGGFYLWQVRNSQGWRRILPSRHLLIALGVLAVVVAPWVAYVNQQTGYPFTDGRQAWVLNRVLARVGLAGGRSGALPREPEALQPFLKEQITDPVFVEGWSDRTFFEDGLMEVVKGFFPLYLPLVAFGLFLRRRDFRWLGGDGYLLAVLAGHTLLLLAVTGFQWTQKRYVIQAMPFMLPWAGLGVSCLFARLAGWPGPARARWILTALLAAVFSLALWGGNGKAFEDRRGLGDDPEIRTAMLVKEWFASNPLDYGEASRGVVSTERQYHNGRRPLIAGFEQRQLYFAGGDRVFLPAYGAGLTLDDLALICRVKGVDLVLWVNVDEARTGFNMFNFYPHLRGLGENENFRLLDRLSGENTHIVEIYAFTPRENNPAGLAD